MTILGIARGAMLSRGLALGIAGFGLLLGSSPAAWASPGCTALAGSFGPSSVYSGSNAGTGFSAGDVITVTVLNAGGGQVGLADYTTWTQLVAGATSSFSYPVPADTPNEFRVLYTGTATTEITWSCAAGAPPAPKGSTDSTKVRQVQIAGSTIAAQMSGQAITGAVGGAIGDAFSGGGAPITANASGFTLNFGADSAAASPGRVARRTDEAFSALAYAPARNVTKAPPLSPVFDRRWSAWLDVRGSGWDKSSAIDGNQINVTGGVGYKVTPNILVGVFGGYEDFRYDFDALSGKLKGDGGTVGGYAAWQIAPTLRWDAMLGWSSISYDANAGTASGNFDGSRWLLSTGLTGFYRYAAYILEPSAKVYALWERQDAWTDSLGTLQADRSFSTGRMSLGGRVIAPSQYNAFSLAPYLGFYGDWRFSSDNALPVSVPNVGLVDGWSGRVTGGVSMNAPGGGTLSLGGEYGGIGAGYGVWTANARALWPF